jgi:predicted nucleotidyltransferase
VSSQRSPNRDRLIRTARRLEPLLDQLVFVGGQMTELLVTDPAASRPRPTDDVDVVVAVSTKTAYERIQLQLRALGFQPDRREGAPLCRFCTSDNLVLDAMPLDEGVLGFSNRWYAHAIETAQPLELDPGLVIRAISTPTFLATKWEAYASRGDDNPIMSHDLEDIIVLVAGRPSLLDELRAAPSELRQHVAERTGDFLRHPSFDEVVEDALPDARRFPGLVKEVVERLRMIASD